MWNEIVFSLANLIEHGDIDLPLALERRVGRALITPALHRDTIHVGTVSSTATSVRSSRSGTGCSVGLATAR